VDIVLLIIIGINGIAVIGSILLLNSRLKLLKEYIDLTRKIQEEFIDESSEKFKTISDVLEYLLEK